MRDPPTFDASRQRNQPDQPGRPGTAPRVDSTAMDTPTPDPAKLLGIWMEWERGEIPPGKTLSDLKRASMRVLLEELAAAAPIAAPIPAE
jgi:hypothetical protein